MKWYVTPLIDTLMPDYTTPIVTHIVDDTCQDIYGPPPADSPQYEPGMIHPSTTNAWNFPGEGGEQALYTPFDPPSLSPPPPPSACSVEGCLGKCMQNGSPHDAGPCQTFLLPNDIGFINRGQGEPWRLSCDGNWYPALGKIFRNYGPPCDWGIISSMTVTMSTYTKHVDPMGTITAGDVLSSDGDIFHPSGADMPPLRVDHILVDLLPKKMRIAIPVPAVAGAYPYPCHRDIVTSSDQWNGYQCWVNPCTSSGCRGRWIGSFGHWSTCKHDATFFYRKYTFRWDPIIIADVEPSVGVTGGWLPIATAGGMLGGLLLGGVASAIQPISTLAAALQYQAQAAAQRRRDA